VSIPGGSRDQKSTSPVWERHYIKKKPETPSSEAHDPVNTDAGRSSCILRACPSHMQRAAASWHVDTCRGAGNNPSPSRERSSDSPSHEQGGKRVGQQPCEQEQHWSRLGQVNSEPRHGSGAGHGQEIGLSRRQAPAGSREREFMVCFGPTP
jgi:hypothetical protein